MDHRATIHEGKLLPTWIYLTTLRASLPRRRLARWVLTSLVGPGKAPGVPPDTLGPTSCVFGRSGQMAELTSHTQAV